MIKNRVSFPREALDRWLVNGEVELARGLLTARTERRRYGSSALAAPGSDQELLASLSVRDL